LFEKAACAVSDFAGHPLAMLLSTALIGLLWAVWGLETANIAISIVSLALLHLLQSSQNRDGAALQTKLDALIKASDAPDDVAGIDKLPREVIEERRGT
jgi:low affinity Fe/Cu permease